MSRINISDVTIIIPYYMDSKERYENLCAVYSFLTLKFHVKILIVKYAGSSSKVPDGAVSLQLPYWNGVFHRTMVINEGIKFATTPYVAIYDCDCIFNVSSIVESVDLLRHGATLVYPFNGCFVDIGREYIKEGVKIEHPSYAVNSYGGACFLNREDYIKCGMDNEYLLNAWCHDDIERFKRVSKLGYKVERVDGKCYHIVHPPSADSKKSPSNEEYNKVANMSKEDLESYIKTWEWVK